MAGKGKRQILACDPASVISDANPLDSALLDFDFNTGSTGIKGVVEEFPQHAGRPLDNFARSDLADHDRIERPDPRQVAGQHHASSSSAAPSASSPPAIASFLSFLARAFSDIPRSAEA